MKTFIFFLLLAAMGTTTEPNENSKENFAKQMRPFSETAVGYYEQRLMGSEYSEREKQPQDFIFYPITRTKDAQWFHLAWLMPTSKERPLDQIFMCFTPHNADSAKIAFYDVPNPENFSKEWAKKQPFAAVDFASLTMETALTTGFLLLKKQTDGFYRWYTTTPLPRNTKGAMYNNVQMEFRFYGDKVTAKNDFYKDSQYLMSQEHKAVSFKISSKYKKY